ncbi:MAG: glutamine--fructose-6-phosphate transaminase (isomerizing), partial [Clostridia bacterium]|nr:glutamine--fructose-6-phosphate transaminase (isomerizing) [Clostridia bacterium]
GYTDGGAFLASDVPAILKYTRNIYYTDNHEIVSLSNDGVVFYNLDREEIRKEYTVISWDAEAAEKGGWEHFMLKEIHEQPAVVRNTVNYFLHDGKLDLSELNLPDEYFKDTESIIIIGCGSAYHVGVVAQYILEDIARIPVRVEIASEFRYRKPVLNGKELVIVISQSGETADSLAALREMKEQGIRTLAIVNVLGSSIAREADSVFYTKAGPEISVATTKAYSAQLIAMYMIALKFAKVRATISEEYYTQLKNELLLLPEKIETVLGSKEQIQKFASEMMDKQDVFFIGRGIDYAVSIESSLKLKEISYIHSEAYAAGELKHGTISLIENGTLVLGILTQSKLTEKTISNLVETASRGAYVAVLASENTLGIPDSFKKVCA